MACKYSQLSPDEQSLLQRGLNAGESVRSMARQMGRSPSTLSREVHRGICGKTYDAVGGRGWARSHRRRGRWKLVPASPLTEKVESLILGKAWSLGQIAGRRQVEHPEDPKQRVSHETIYPYIYTHPAGELKKLLLEALRQGRGKRKPRSRGNDRRGGGVRRGASCWPSQRSTVVRRQWARRPIRTGGGRCSGFRHSMLRIPLGFSPSKEAKAGVSSSSRDVSVATGEITKIK